MLTAENSDQWEYAMIRNIHLAIANLLFPETCFYLTYFTGTQADRYTSLRLWKDHDNTIIVRCVASFEE